MHDSITAQNFVFMILSTKMHIRFPDFFYVIPMLVPAPMLMVGIISRSLHWSGGCVVVFTR